MTLHTIHVSEPWFTLIKTGKKTVEGRLNKGIFKEIKKNDIIVFYNKDLGLEVKTKVIQVNKYNSFYEMINKNGLDKVLPGIKTISKGVAIYRQYYREEDEKELGVIGITIHVKL